MDMTVYRSLMNLMKRKKVTIAEINALFYTEDINEFFDIVSDFIDDNIEELYKDSEFFECYHLFLYTMGNLVKSSDDIFSLKNLIARNIKSIKNKLKDYNKHLIPKDKKYFELSNYLNQLKNNSIYLEQVTEEYFENEDYMIIWFVINVLKNADYLFRLIEVNPDYINIKNRNNSPLFIEIVTHFISNLSQMSDEDKKYYKRIVVMFLESDNFKLNNDQLYGLLEYLENNLSGLNVDEKRNVSFIINEIERHYVIINGDYRVNAIDYCNTDCPIEIINRDNDSRVDLRNLLTISIDAVNKNDVSGILIDDAFSYVDHYDTTATIYVHVPDVDFFVEKDSETDKYMRGIGESVYAKGYKTPMLNYEIAKRCSLVQGQDRNAITFAFTFDNLGNLIDTKCMKSIINVNYNFSKNKAEIFYHKIPDYSVYFLLSGLNYWTNFFRKQRGESVGKRRMVNTIIEEINILPDVLMAGYFQKNGIVFPYKNYLGKRSVRNALHVSECEEFNRENNISENGRNVLYSIFDIYNRVYYDTIPVGNKSFNGLYVGNLGNPLREYISLETCRLIKDIVICGKDNFAYWEDRIERDCIEYTETSAKIKQLYNGNIK